MRKDNEHNISIVKRKSFGFLDIDAELIDFSARLRK